MLQHKKSMTMVIIAKLHCIVDYIHNIQQFHFLFFMEKDRLKMTEFFQDVPDINRSGTAELSLVYILLDIGKLVVPFFFPKHGC